MDLLVFNCGSSSQGFTVFHQNGTDEPDIIAFGKARNVATLTKSAAMLEWNVGGASGRTEADFSTHRLAAESILSVLRQNHVSVDAVGHRFVNGGKYFKSTVQLDDAALEKLRGCFSLAPIHNPNSYSVIEVCREQMPDIPQYAVFDTAFHSELPEERTTYAIPQKQAKEHGWRKIGFHGLSYQYISGRAAALTGIPMESIKLVMCHLGTGGSSVCAFENGHSVDTSMGWSTTTGLVMSTRSGDVDPEIVLDMVRKGMTPDQVSDMLHKHSGLLAVSEYSSNLGEIIEAAENGNKECRLAFELYTDRLRGYIGSFLYKLNGADALVFTDDAGIKYAKVREAVCRNTDFFGVCLDDGKNRMYDGKTEACLSMPESRIQVWAIPTDEERTIYNEIINMMKDLK
ncbi:MAG: acetate/propionate family kinase [Anaerolineaceae bacterium]|nr:acetate/propionate family kinase [Anaerolineaceae bacterium]